MTAGGEARHFVVTVPVTDLRRKPVEGPLMNIHDDLQDSQLLFNERLALETEEKDWLHAEAIEQLKASGEAHSGWVRRKDVEEEESPPEYDGLVKSAFTDVLTRPLPGSPRLFPLPIGTRLLLTGGATRSFFETVLPRKKTGWVPRKDVIKRTGPVPGRPTGQDLVKTARLFLGIPYFWGGRSMPMPWSRGPITGVDCSALVNLVFRAHDIDVPRDAHEQWLVATPIEAYNIGPGDLIFLSREQDTAFIDHVMIFCGGEQFIEAPRTGEIVRIRTFTEKFGLDRAQLRQKDFFAGKRKLYFGRMKAS